MGIDCARAARFEVDEPEAFEWLYLLPTCLLIGA